LTKNGHGSDRSRCENPRDLWIDYEVDKVDNVPASGAEVDGNHVGVHVDFMF